MNEPLELIRANPRTTPIENKGVTSISSACHPELTSTPGVEHRRHVDELEARIRQLPGASVANEKSELGLGCKYEHSFTDGLYIRKMFIPKGLMIVTKVHKTKHPYFIMYGDVTVNLDGDQVRIQGPYSGVTEPGTKRSLYTWEDTLWITVHVTEKTDVEAISKDVVADSYEEYDQFKRLLEEAKPCRLESQQQE